MKRVGHLWDKVVALENLELAFYKTAKQKSCKCAVIRFREALDENLELLSKQLSDGSYMLEGYHFFTIFDPKKRTICAAPFSTRVIFHAVMNVCEPYFDRYQMPDSYACRKGKGTIGAVERARFFCNRYRWFVKMDVVKFFDSIDHQVLLRSLSRLFKDRQLLCFFSDLVLSYSVAEGKGMPMGNLTSQFFANHYMALADRFVKETLKVDGMVRYMDDVLLFGDDKDELLRAVREYERFLDEKLCLRLHPMVLNRACFGVPFLGFVVHGYTLRLNQRSRRRLRLKARSLSSLWLCGGIAEESCVESMRSAMAFVGKADIKGIRKQFFG